MTAKEAKKMIIEGYCTNPSPICHGLKTYPDCNKIDRPCYQAMQIMEKAIDGGKG